jgi:methyl-accepting chemotaxis protein
MARRSAPSSFNSLKGKISIATSAMAIFTCAFGSIVYLTVSYLIKDTFFTVFVPFLLMAFVILVFGWWISNEVIAPILKLSLLARSIERSPMASLPKTSGSGETDELLDTLYRNSRQLQEVVGMMENVANGNLDIALTPLQNSDRLVTSFQKLLARVSESIYAKENLGKLEADIEEMTAELARTRSGNLEVDIKGDLIQTKELSDTIKFLIHRLNELISQVGKGALQAGSIAVDAQRVIQDVILQDEAQVREMKQAAVRLQESPNRVQKISEELSSSISSAHLSLDKARKGTHAAEQNTHAVNTLRKQVKEAIKKIQMLSERSQEIAKVAKNLDDLANRSNLIALNASIHAVGTKDTGSGFSLLAEEVERLSERAEGASRQISALNKSIAAEIEEVEAALHSTVSEVANISKFALEAGNSLGELERYIGQFLNLQSKLAVNSSQQTAETEQALQVFTASLSESARVIGSLRETGVSVANLSGLMENLKSSIADFRVPHNEALPPGPLEEPAMMDPGEFAESIEPAEQFQIQGDA